MLVGNKTINLTYVYKFSTSWTRIPKSQSGATHKLELLAGAGKSTSGGLAQISNQASDETNPMRKSKYSIHIKLYIRILLD